MNCCHFKNDLGKSIPKLKEMLLEAHKLFQSAESSEEAQQAMALIEVIEEQFDIKVAKHFAR